MEFPAVVKMLPHYLLKKKKLILCCLQLNLKLFRAESIGLKWNPNVIIYRLGNPRQVI